MATTNRAEALEWATALAPQGVEGLVAKALGSAYRPADRSSWVKWRPTDTADARLVGITGPPGRPHAVVVELADGHRTVTSPRLSPTQSRQVAMAIGNKLGAPSRTASGTTVTAVLDGPLVEARTGTGRHGSTRFVRLRGDI